MKSIPLADLPNMVSESWLTQTLCDKCDASATGSLRCHFSHDQRGNCEWGRGPRVREWLQSRLIGAGDTERTAKGSKVRLAGWLFRMFGLSAWSRVGSERGRSVGRSVRLFVHLELGSLQRELASYLTRRPVSPQSLRPPLLCRLRLSLFGAVVCLSRLTSTSSRSPVCLVCQRETVKCQFTS